MSGRTEPRRMDPEELREEVAEWVEAGVIDRETGAAILERYETTLPEGTEPEGGPSRIVTAIGLMGGLLVAVGIAVFVSQFWSDIPRAIRGVVLVSVPAAGFAGGAGLVRGAYPRVGHGLWFGAAGFAGVSSFYLAELFAPGLGAHWRLLAWTAVALPAAHAFPSRPTAGLGLVVAGSTVLGTAAELGADPVVPVGLVGALLFLLGAWLRERSLAGVYRLVGVGLVAVALLGVATREGRFGTADAGGAVAAALAVAALAVAALDARDLLAGGGRSGADTSVAYADQAAIRWGGGVLAVLGLLAALVTAAPRPPGIGLAATHLLALAVFVGAVAVAHAGGDRGVRNVVAVAFLVQIAIFLGSTVGDALEGGLALVVAGAVLLVVGFGLERGRRRLLSRMAGG